ncbi:uncharacterized protein GGS25DRAFT_489472 [Hypoxylon fragiforme]|uniref:uncharacterized protein n=1 Tax=Hypoxylon fragiforme TaxID=63214 RepID=UPI0020C6DDD3|nr:uncharacterized protein GGS25DRAFT_489472 [Hypoxylon fragiforme]KAI2608267.1 hypothetical protein GGS25DRAFT_489472 [Hypoxylon fragiforme]
MLKKGPDEETFIITRSRMQDIEAKYRNVTSELAERTKLCESLRQTCRLNGVPETAIPPQLPPHSPTDEEVVTVWSALREQIRALTLNRFNNVIPVKNVPEKNRREFEYLSTHWRSYMTNGQLTSYIFRALIWRYLDTCLFGKYCRVWGKEPGDAAAKLAGLFSSSPKVADVEFQEWRMQTAALFQKACVPDLAVKNEVAGKILEATTNFASGVDTEGLSKAIASIVDTAAGLSAIFASTQFGVLMSDKPGSDLTRGFPHQVATMEIKGKLGSTGVDMIISPCLLKKEADYTILVKAEVIC